MLYFILGLENYQVQARFESLRLLNWPKRKVQKVHFDGSLEDFENIFLLEPLLPEEEQKVF